MPGSSLGERLAFTSFGESHGKCIGAVIDGCPAGLKLDEKDIQPMLDLRRPGQSQVTTQRKEGDQVEIISGVFRGHTTGAPITMVIWNKDMDSRSYDELVGKIRPGHSDYPAMIKYKGYNDYRGGGRFSGRLTATFVMAGALAKKLVKETLDIDTYSYTAQIGKVKMKESYQESQIESGKKRNDAKDNKTSARANPKRIKNETIYSNEVRCPESDTAAKMKTAILKAKKNGDSLGGVVESITTNVPAGIGDPIFGSLESDISKAMYSIPSVKGVEFGSGFYGSTLHGSQNNDEFVLKGSRILTDTNNSGGILGGLSTGMPLMLRVAFKPASSIAKEQNTVDTKKKKPAKIVVKGRHDPCVVPRAPPVVDAMVSLVLADHCIRAGLIHPVL